MTTLVKAVREKLAERARGVPLEAFDRQVAGEILQRMCEGQLLMEICAEGEGYPMPHTVRRWALENPEFRKEFEGALEMQAHMLFEEAVYAARNATKDDANLTRMLTDNLYRAAGKLLPKVYGEKSEQSTIVPIQVITNLGDGKSVEGVTNQGYRVQIDRGSDA